MNKHDENSTTWLKRDWLGKAHESFGDILYETTSQQALLIYYISNGNFNSPTDVCNWNELHQHDTVSSSSCWMCVHTSFVGSHFLLWRIFTSWQIFFIVFSKLAKTSIFFLGFLFTKFWICVCVCVCLIFNLKKKNPDSQYEVPFGRLK